jgi:DNA-binding MarR family transcriptional regulator
MPVYGVMHPSRAVHASRECFLLVPERGFNAPLIIHEYPSEDEAARRGHIARCPHCFRVAKFIKTKKGTVRMSPGALATLRVIACAVADCGKPATARYVAAKRQRTKGTCSEQLAKLTNRGLIRRESSTGAKFYNTNIFVTEKGMETLAVIDEQRRIDAEQGLPTEERAIDISIMRRTP